MKFATIRLSKENDPTDVFDLKYTLIDNTFTKKWINCVLEAQQRRYEISEPWALYNINDKLSDNFVLEKLNSLMSQVDKEENLFGFKLESIYDKDKLNKIHSVFEKHHGKLDEWKDNPIFKNKSENFRKNLSEVNQFVHACENRHGSPKIRIVWFDLPKVNKFDDEDYKLFTNKKTFGSLYHLYADVGKNIESLAVDNDDHHHDVVPNIHFSADCVAYFCSDTEKQVAEYEKKFNAFVEENAEYLDSRGYKKNDTRLTTGRIEIGKLGKLDEKKLMSKLRKYDYIQSFFLS